MRWTTTIFSRMRAIWQYRHEPENLRALAEAYWRALLAVSLLVFLLLVSYAGAKFYEIFMEEGTKAPLLSGGGETIPLLNAKELEATIRQLEARKARYEFLKKNPPKIADPSK